MNSQILPPTLSSLNESVRMLLKTIKNDEPIEDNLRILSDLCTTIFRTLDFLALTNSGPELEKFSTVTKNLVVYTLIFLGFYRGKADSRTLEICFKNWTSEFDFYVHKSNGDINNISYESSHTDEPEDSYLSYIQKLLNQKKYNIAEKSLKSRLYHIEAHSIKSHKKPTSQESNKKNEIDRPIDVPVTPSAPRTHKTSRSRTVSNSGVVKKQYAPKTVSKIASRESSRTTKKKTQYRESVDLTKLKHQFPNMSELNANNTDQENNHSETRKNHRTISKPIGLISSPSDRKLTPRTSDEKIDPNFVSIEGLLYKKLQDNPEEKRWCILDLNQKKLTYAKAQGYKPVGEIDLGEADNIELVIESSPDDEGKILTGFEISSSISNFSYCFLTHDNNVADNFCFALYKLIHDVRPKGSVIVELDDLEVEEKTNANEYYFDVEIHNSKGEVRKMGEKILFSSNVTKAQKTKVFIFSGDQDLGINLFKNVNTEEKVFGKISISLKKIEEGIMIKKSYLLNPMGDNNVTVGVLLNLNKKVSASTLLNATPKSPGYMKSPSNSTVNSEAKPKFDSIKDTTSAIPIKSSIPKTNVAKPVPNTLPSPKPHKPTQYECILHVRQKERSTRPVKIGISNSGITLMDEAGNRIEKWEMQKISKCSIGKDNKSKKRTINFDLGAWSDQELVIATNKVDSMINAFIKAQKAAEKAKVLETEGEENGVLFNGIQHYYDYDQYDDMALQFTDAGIEIIDSIRQAVMHHCGWKQIQQYADLGTKISLVPAISVSVEPWIIESEKCKQIFNNLKLNINIRTKKPEK